MNPGAQVGSYCVLSELGRGGMGAVFTAEHVHMKRSAVVKVLLPEFSKNQEIVQRFFNEARAASQLSHPGIVDVFDFGFDADNNAYIIMELLEGESLADRKKRLGKLPVTDALRIVRSTCSALRAAHAAGIVHRDLKPDNIFLVQDPDYGERAKVLDFGIAKLTDGAGGGGAVKTRTGAVMGTPAYMAPEQCEGSREIDHRADLYSMGCILYELISGQMLFNHAGAGKVLAAQIYEVPIPLRQRQPSVSVEIDAVVMRLLVKDPNTRTNSIHTLITELDGLLGAHGRAPTSQTAATSHTTLLAGPEAVARLPEISSDALRPATARPETVALPAPTTTLSAAATAVAQTKTSARPRWLAPGIIGLGVFVGVAVAVMTLGGGGDNTNAASDSCPDGTKQATRAIGTATFTECLNPNGVKHGPTTLRQGEATIRGSFKAGKFDGKWVHTEGEKTSTRGYSKGALVRIDGTRLPTPKPVVFPDGSKLAPTDCNPDDRHHVFVYSMDACINFFETLQRCADDKNCASKSVARFAMLDLRESRLPPMQLPAGNLLTKAVCRSKKDTVKRERCVEALREHGKCAATDHDKTRCQMNVAQQYVSDGKPPKKPVQPDVDLDVDMADDE